MLYDNLVMLCKSKGVNMSNMLRDIGEYPSRGTKIKDGTVPNYTVLVKMAEYFGVQVEDLFSANLDPREAVKVDTEKLDDFERALLDIYRQLDIVDKNQLINMVFEFAKEKEVKLS